MIDLATVRPLLGVSDPTRAGGVPVAGEVLTRDPDQVAGEVAYTMRSLLVAFLRGRGLFACGGRTGDYSRPRGCADFVCKNVRRMSTTIRIYPALTVLA